MALESRKLVFAGSGPGSPWSALGIATARALRPLGYEVEVVRKPGPSNPVAVASGEADLGGATLRIVLDALAGTPASKGQPLDTLRRIATVDWPNWLAVAVRRSLGIASLDQIRERKLPLRVLARDDKPTQRLLAAHGFSLADVEAWGGKVYRLTIPAEEIAAGGRNPDAKPTSELVKGDYVDMILGPCWTSLGEFGTYWRQASCFLDLRFLPLREDAIELLCREFGFEPLSIPALTFEGVDEDVPTAGESGLVIYTRAETPDELVQLVAQALDEHSDELTRFRHHFAYNPRGSASAERVPLHPGAARYYAARQSLVAT
jgi:TRAP-type uncharacterized transport system substrate-binding protein